MKIKVILLGLLFAVAVQAQSDSIFTYGSGADMQVLWNPIDSTVATFVTSDTPTPPGGGLANGVISLWELDESSAPLEDAVGDNDVPSDSINDISYQSATVSNLNYSVSFGAGADPYVRPTTADLELQPPFSVSFWFKEASASDYYLRLYGSEGWRFNSSSGGIVTFRVYGDGLGTADSNVDLTDDAWHNLIGVCDGDSTILYVDGVLQTNVDLDEIGTIDYTDAVFEWGTNAGAYDYAV